jgi:transposase-like protein
MQKKRILGVTSRLTCPPKPDPHGMLKCDKMLYERGYAMKKKRYTPEQIIEKLREAEVRLSKGESVGKTCRSIGVSEQTYYRWRNEYGGMRIAQAKRLKEIEKENSRLRKVVADLSLDNAILKEATKGNF